MFTKKIESLYSSQLFCLHYRRNSPHFSNLEPDTRAKLAHACCVFFSLSGRGFGRGTNELASCKRFSSRHPPETVHPKSFHSRLYYQNSVGFLSIQVQGIEKKGYLQKNTTKLTVCLDLNEILIRRVRYTR